MSKYSGYMGRVAKIDLTTGKLEDYPWSDKDRELFIGGKMMAAKILYDNLTGKEEALSEDNIIVIATGPLTGTGAPSSNHFNISTVSPETGLIASTDCGGNFGYYLKRAGFDALVLTGKCPEPSWLDIYNETVTVHSAEREGVWGMRLADAQQHVHDVLDRDYGCRVKCGILAIGPAGENLVPFAGVYSEDRTAGEGGTGAVFGAKNLKAIGVSGNKHVTVANEKKALALNKKWAEQIRKHPVTGTQLPKDGNVGFINAVSADEGKLVCTETLADSYNVCNKGCLSCPIKCERAVEWNGKMINDPAFEALGALGNAGYGDILKWTEELDQLGMDSEAAAQAVIGALKADELCDAEKVSAAFESIALGRTSVQAPAAAVVKGLELAASNRGGCWAKGGYLAVMEALGLNVSGLAEKTKAELVCLVQNLFETIAASGQCQFTGYTIVPGSVVADPKSALAGTVNKALAKLGPVLSILNKHPEVLFFPLSVFNYDREMKAVVGMKMNLGKFLRCGERGYTLERYLNGVFGVAEKEETLPVRLSGELTSAKDENLEKLMKAYYAVRGWSKEGVPTESTLKKLGVKKN